MKEFTLIQALLVILNTSMVTAVVALYICNPLTGKGFQSCSKCNDYKAACASFADAANDYINDSVRFSITFAEYEKAREERMRLAHKRLLK